MRQYEEEYTEEYEERPRRRRSPGALLVMIVLGLAIVVVLVVTHVRKKTTYTSWETAAEYPGIPGASCLKTTNGFVLYNNDGAEGHAADGKVTWKISYEFGTPIAAVGGDFAAFADKGKTEVHVTGGDGSNNVINVAGKVAGLCVAGQGVTAVRTDDGDSDHIYLYDISGAMLLDIRTEVRKSGFPVTMALSPDGRKLVTSYIKAGQTQESWVTFYNFGDVGQNYTDKIVGSYSFKDDLIPDVRFLGNERVLVTGPTGSILYKFREVPEEMKKYSGDGVLASVTGGAEGFILAREQNTGIRLITLYDINGSEQMKIETGVSYDSLLSAGGELIITSGDACIIYRKDGREKFRAKMNDTIELMYPTGTKATYTVVEENSVEVIRLTTESQQEKAAQETIPDEAVEPQTEEPDTQLE